MLDRLRSPILIAGETTLFAPALLLLALFQQSPGHERMLRLLQELAARSPEEHFFLSEVKNRALRSELERMRPDAPEVLRFEIRVKLGEEEQRLGREREAIELFEEAYRLLPAVESEVSADWIVRFLFDIAMAYMRFGETQNCALGHGAEACILPIRGSGLHLDQAPSRRAIFFFREVLKRARPESDPYLSSVWLLNIAYMTVGAYPDEVPDDYRIPPESFASDAEFPRFPNVAMEAGVDSFTLSGGVVVEDFDLDGRFDMLVTTYAPDGQARLFLDDGDGTFTDVAEPAGILGILGGLNMVQGDYDNDGDIDVLLLRGAWMGKGGAAYPNSLLRNNGDGTFTDVTFATGLGDVHYPTQTASWGDYDNDGDLDLFVGNESEAGLEAPSQLFENRGDATFEDVAARAGVQNLRFTKAVVFGDYDFDRFPDIYVSNLNGPNRLYRNLGDGTFTDVAPALGVTGPLASFPAWFWDYDNDGVLDLYVSAYGAFIDDLALFHLGRPREMETQRLYRGDGSGGFQDVTEAVRLAEPNAPMGANFGDLDNDGYPDFYLGTGYPPYYAVMPNVMYWNRGGKDFADVTTAGGFGHLQKGHAIAFADLDGDGDQDVFEQMGGALAGDRFWDVLYRNPGFGSRWLELELAGVVSNRAGIGARIRVEVVERGERRSIYKHVNSGGSFGANSVGRQMLGLGRAERIVALEVYWPASRRTQKFPGVALDRRYLLREGASRLETLPDPSR